MRLARRPARHRKILARNVHQAAVNLRASCDHSIRGQFFSRHAEVGGAMCGEQSHFLKAVLVHQPFQTFARRKFSTGMLFGKAQLSSALFDLSFSRPQFADLVLRRGLADDFQFRGSIRCRCHDLLLGRADTCLGTRRGSFLAPRVPGRHSLDSRHNTNTTL